MTPDYPTQPAVDAAGDLFGDSPRDGGIDYTTVTGWKFLTATNARQLAAGDGDAIDEFSSWDVWISDNAW